MYKGSEKDAMEKHQYQAFWQIFNFLPKRLIRLRE
jgi:hypothetical protein